MNTFYYLIKYMNHGGKGSASGVEVRQSSMSKVSRQTGRYPKYLVYYISYFYEIKVTKLLTIQYDPANFVWQCNNNSKDNVGDIYI